MSVMHIVLCRKPVEGTVSSNVVEHGTGGLNIDGCRIATGGESLAGGVKAGGGSATDGWDRPFMHDKEAMKIWGENKKANQAKATQLGRFPANVILSHHPDCVCVGKKKVRGSKPIPSGYDRLNKKQAELGYRPNEYQKGKVEPSYSHVDSDGNETIESWQCHEDCPIKKLDEQSGVTKSTGGSGDKSMGGLGKRVFGEYALDRKGNNIGGLGDTGGASRFFKNIQEE